MNNQKKSDSRIDVVSTPSDEKVSRQVNNPGDIKQQLQQVTADKELLEKLRPVVEKYRQVNHINLQITENILDVLLVQLKQLPVFTSLWDKMIKEISQSIYDDPEGFRRLDQLWKDLTSSLTAN